MRTSMYLRRATRMNDPDRREAYGAIRQRWPELFANPPDSPYEILFDSSLIDDAERCEATRLSQKGLPATWSRTGVVFEDPYLIIVRDAVRRPDDSLGTYVRILPASGSAGAAVLPVLNEH